MEQRQCVRYLFLKLDPVWRRLDAREQRAHKEEFGSALKRFHARLLVRTYSVVGTRGDADLMFWQAAQDLETLQAFETAVFSTSMGAYFEIAHSFLALTRKSIYEFPDDPEKELRDIVRPADNRYLFLYPFVKTREWHALPFEKRQQAMEEHVTIGRKYPSLRLNTTYSFGLDDQEFMVAFEGDDPGAFLDLVMELRSSVASTYTERDTPTFTCLQMSIWDALDALGGTPVSEEAVDAVGDRDGYTRVATVADVPPGTGKRVYLGTEAVALFNVAGQYHAINDRCTHGRASLSEGTVDAARCVLECPWHGGTFDLVTGEPVGGPPRVAVKTYSVKVHGDDVLVR